MTADLFKILLGHLLLQPVSSLAAGNNYVVHDTVGWDHTQEVSYYQVVVTMGSENAEEGAQAGVVWVNFSELLSNIFQEACQCSDK